MIHEWLCESSISWAIRAFKLVCLPAVTLEKDWETWLPACNSACFWGTYYSAILYCLRHSFVALHLYYGLVFEAFVRDKDFAATRSSTLGAQRIVLPRFSILSEYWGFLRKKPKDNIRSWARKVCSRCWRSWRCCTQTQPLVRAVLNHSARSWQMLEDRLLSYYSAFRSVHLSGGGRRWRVFAW